MVKRQITADKCWDIIVKSSSSSSINKNAICFAVGTDFKYENLVCSLFLSHRSQYIYACSLSLSRIVSKSKHKHRQTKKDCSPFNFNKQMCVLFVTFWGGFEEWNEFHPTQHPDRFSAKNKTNSSRCHPTKQSDRLLLFYFCMNIVWYQNEEEEEQNGMCVSNRFLFESQSLREIVLFLLYLYFGNVNSCPHWIHFISIVISHSHFVSLAVASVCYWHWFVFPKISNYIRTHNHNNRLQSPFWFCWLKSMSILQTTTQRRWSEKVRLLACVAVCVCVWDRVLHFDNIIKRYIYPFPLLCQRPYCTLSLVRSSS